MKFLAPLIPLLGAVATAKEIRWTATGQVTAVGGSGFAASAGNPVSIKFAYASDADRAVRASLGNYSEVVLQGALKLSIEVTIGANTWTASMQQTAGEVMNVKGDSGFVNLDTLRITATNSNGGTFPNFPYTGSSPLRTFTIILNDNNSPSRFLDPMEYPDEGSRVASISSGNGAVRAGSDVINYVITPGTIKVTTDEPPLPLAIVQTPAGLKLRWPSELGRIYRIQSCERIPEWENTGFEFGTGSDAESAVVSSQEELVRRRFYRVISE